MNSWISSKEIKKTMNRGIKTVINYPLNVELCKTKLNNGYKLSSQTWRKVSSWSFPSALPVTQPDISSLDQLVQQFLYWVSVTSLDWILLCHPSIQTFRQWLADPVLAKYSLWLAGWSGLLPARIVYFKKVCNWILWKLFHTLEHFFLKMNWYRGNDKK